MARRIRKHANPFSIRVELGLLDRAQLFGREGPLEVELGTGAGRFLWDRALANPGLDFVGLEIREQLVEQRMARPDRPKNLVYLVANANQNLRLAPPGVIQMFHVHFPDPCFRGRHYKRRVLQSATVRVMSELLPLGGKIYAQSDVRLLAEEMYRILAGERSLEPRLPPDMLAPRPVPEMTEWERHHEAEAEPIYRLLFEKVRAPEGELVVVPLGPVKPTPA
ncbi:MAG: hypothetical protein U1E65_07715 [Myxococcota bacterium]